MANSRADVYLASIEIWGKVAKYRAEIGRPPVPPPRPGTDRVVPTISLGDSWSRAIDAILDEVKPPQLIEKLYIAGHGAAGQILVGQTLRFDDDSAIAEFRRLRPVTASWLTNIYLVGCESASEGPCNFGPLTYYDEKGKTHTIEACLGPFTGNTSKPGYQLLRKLANAANAPVHGSAWMKSMADSWEPGWASRLTVGPGGGWAYHAINQSGTIFGSP